MLIKNHYSFILHKPSIYWSAFVFQKFPNGIISKSCQYKYYNEILISHKTFVSLCTYHPYRRIEYLQCFPKCRLQHGGWRGQPLIVQVPAGKSKAIPLLYSGLQLSKITKINNHVPYNMRCWKYCLPPSTHFWHVFMKCAFTRINSISEIQSISRLIVYLLSILLMCGGSLLTLYFSSAPIDKNRKLPQKNWKQVSSVKMIISEDELMRVNVHFLKRC